MSATEAREAYDRAITALRLMRGDALVGARAAADLAPGCVAPRLLIASLLLYSRDRRDAVQGAAALAQLEPLPMDAREAGHVRALRAGGKGDFAAARAMYDQILEEALHDDLALWAAQVLDYYLGDPQALRARIQRVLP